MIFKTTTLKLTTKSSIQLIEITSQVEDFCQSQKVQNGLVVVSSHHTTAAISINEKCEKLEKDFINFVAKLAEPKENYFHNKSPIDNRPNAHSHLLKYLMSTSETVVIRDGKLSLGQWQRIFFVELDGARKKREVHLMIMGEK